MLYDEIESPIGAEPTEEAFKVAYVVKDRELRRWLCGWDDGPRWSEKREDAIWIDPEVARAIKDHFGHYLKDFGVIRLLDREPRHERLKEIVGRDYWNHIT